MLAKQRENLNTQRADQAVAKRFYAGPFRKLGKLQRLDATSYSRKAHPQGAMKSCPDCRLRHRTKQVCLSMMRFRPIPGPQERQPNE